MTQATEEADVMQAIDNIFNCVEAVKRNAGKERNISGLMTCPVCGGKTLAYQVGHNGHTHGKCSNECAAWNE